MGLFKRLRKLICKVCCCIKPTTDENDHNNEQMGGALQPVPPRALVRWQSNLIVDEPRYDFSFGVLFIVLLLNFILRISDSDVCFLHITITFWSG